MPNLVDIHSHLYFSDFDGDRDQVIARMREIGVATISIGTGLETSKQAIALARQYSFMPAAVGIHPLSVEEYAGRQHEQLLDDVTFLAKNREVVAIGEVGLDYGAKGKSPISIEQKILQTVLFEGQLRIAAELDKPVIIHCRNAYGDVLDIVKRHKKSAPNLHVHFHFFAGSLEELKEILDLGFTVSYTGVITFAESYEPLVAATPLDRIMIETDAPYVAPVPWRGKRAEPWMVEATAKKIADIHGVDLLTVVKITTKNAQRVFGTDFA